MIRLAAAAGASATLDGIKAKANTDIADRVGHLDAAMGAVTAAKGGSG